MLLQAEGLSKRYDDKTVLRQVCLSLKENSSLAITGPSGSGKTTLLSILGLLLEPTEGTVLFRGQNITALPDDQKSALRNRAFGFIFQGTQLINSLTVLDNVLVPAYLARQRGLETKAKQLLDELGMGDRLAYYPHQLSIGQKRRVAIARALLLDPVVVFADEPTNDLDPGLAAWVGDYLLNLPRKGCSLVLVTHDRKLVARADEQLALSAAGFPKKRRESRALEINKGEEQPPNKRHLLPGRKVANNV